MHFFHWISVISKIITYCLMGKLSWFTCVEILMMLWLKTFHLMVFFFIYYFKQLLKDKKLRKQFSIRRISVFIESMFKTIMNVKFLLKISIFLNINFRFKILFIYFSTKKLLSRFYTPLYILLFKKLMVLLQTSSSILFKNTYLTISIIDWPTWPIIQLSVFTKCI